MVKAECTKGQATVELAVFGAILIFVLGTIVRSAVNNGYTQNQNFEAMRMAMLSSWQGTEQCLGSNPCGGSANISHNSATVLFVEDRLSPDFNKYGDLDRTPYIAQGTGVFSYNLLYPWQPGEPVSNLLPIMDAYINGQHFPFTTAAYVTKTITMPTCGNNGAGQNGPYFPPPYSGNALTPGQCLQNQCLRNQREWVFNANSIPASVFENIVAPPVTISPCPLAGNTTDANIQCDAWAIFNELVNEGFLTNANTSAIDGTGTVSATAANPLPSTFASWFEGTFPGSGQAQINQIQSILQSNLNPQIKLFFTTVANGETSGGADGNISFTQPVSNTDSGAGSDTAPGYTFDLFRNNVPANDVPVGMQPYIAWQWYSVAATSESAIGLDPSSNQYPTWDIDGRLKEVTVYGFSQGPGGPTVSYEDSQGGDIDSTWDSNSCGPKPGLESGSQIFSFTQQGTYLQILEGKLYNPETNQFVRSANKKDTIDLVQRMIQLSNNTGRFCKVYTAGALCDGTEVVNGQTVSCADPNPVEVCVDESQSGSPCFQQDTIKETCYDTTSNIIFVRSRLEDTRGHYWITNASGQLQVH